MSTQAATPEVQAKLDCLSRAKHSLREAIVDLEAVMGSQEALQVAAGAMVSMTLIDRLAQRIAQEAAQ